MNYIYEYRGVKVVAHEPLDDSDISYYVGRAVAVSYIYPAIIRVDYINNEAVLQIIYEHPSRTIKVRRP